MDTVDHLHLLFGFLLRQSPTMTVEFIGLWFAFSRRVELGRAAAYAIAGFSLLIVYALVIIVLQHLLAVGRIGETTVISSSARVTRLGLWNLIAYPLFVGGLAALARAVFVGRDVTRVQDDGRDRSAVPPEKGWADRPDASPPL